MFGVLPIISALLWSGVLLIRISQGKEALNSAIPQIFEVPEIITPLENTAELQEQADKTTDEKIAEWEESILDDYKELLNEHLLVRDSYIRPLDQIFAVQLLTLLREVLIERYNYPLNFIDKFERPMFQKI
jgi:hypothetical protein